MSEPSLPASYFDALYAADPDPWRFATSDYERHKYAATLAALPRLHYSRALEVGCSIGVLTRLLARRCEALLSIDSSESPLGMARERCGDCPSVRFLRMTVPQEWPSEEFDLILLSEVVYYLCAADVERLARRVRCTLAPGGDIVLIHWIGATDYPLSGDEATEIFLREVRNFTYVSRRERSGNFRLDVVSRRDSAAQP
jgi:trans-aconitate methyltransferase